jgi:hypothetical protein
LDVVEDVDDMESRDLDFSPEESVLARDFLRGWLKPVGMVTLITGVCGDICAAMDADAGYGVWGVVGLLDGAVQIWRRQRSCLLFPPRSFDSCDVTRTRWLASNEQVFNRLADWE